MHNNEEELLSEYRSGIFDVKNPIGYNNNKILTKKSNLFGKKRSGTLSM